ITIFGESGGARSVNWLMASPLSRGLFHGAIGQSHSVFDRMTTLDEAHRYGEQIVKAAGVSSLEELRALPAETVHEVFLQNPRGMNAAIVDGWFLPEDIYTRFATGEQMDVPLITGGNADEFGRPRRTEGAPKTVEQYRSWLADAYGDVADRVFTAYPASNDGEVQQAYYSLTVDNNFEGHRTWARLHAQNSGSKAFLYMFSHSVPGYGPGGDVVRRGAYHGAEILFVLDNLRAADAPWSDQDRVLADVLSSYWVNFAATGNPNGEGLPQWPAYNPGNEQMMNLGDPLRPRTFNVKGIDAIADHVAGERKH
ncbi:MAG: carboxylesterase family protein, partial [Pseudomonadales bacterium]|nr:carboxylesterase family protein [Pseudomonadales bacterium]